jgi:hypothetical protein
MWASSNLEKQSRTVIIPLGLCTSRQAFPRHLFDFLLLLLTCALKEERLSALSLVENVRSIID